MARIEKNGRSASKEDRARAAALAASYLRGVANPEIRYCINPEEEPESQIFVSEHDAFSLVEALQSFALHGTFTLQGDGKKFFVCMDFNELRSAGMRYADAIAALAEKYNRSESTIERMVRRTVKP